jgi:hypothetical protein
MAAKQGLKVLFCMPNRSRCILLVSVMPDAPTMVLWSAVTVWTTVQMALSTGRVPGTLQVALSTGRVPGPLQVALSTRSRVRLRQRCCDLFAPITGLVTVNPHTTIFIA